jgi:hypothetical protein
VIFVHNLQGTIDQDDAVQLADRGLLTSTQALLADSNTLAAQVIGYTNNSASFLTYLVLIGNSGLSAKWSLLLPIDIDIDRTCN